MPLPPPVAGPPDLSIGYTGAAVTVVPAIASVEFRLFPAGCNRIDDVALRAVVACTPGETLDVRVGGPPDPGDASGGWPNGGNGVLFVAVIPFCAGDVQNTGGFGSCDVFRSGTPLVVNAGNGGNSSGLGCGSSGGGSDPFLLVASVPATTSDNRVPVTTGGAQDAPGLTGGVEFGADSVTFGTTTASGAGGGGFGGGASGECWHSGGGPIYRGEPGRPGTSFGPPGDAAFMDAAEMVVIGGDPRTFGSPPADWADFGLIEVRGAVRGRWHVGSIHPTAI